jgi:hypothetical protein
MTRKRITRRAIGEGPNPELAAKIGGALRHGVLDGVEVDFRHPDLPVDQWEAAPYWYIGYGQTPSHAGVIFPNGQITTRDIAEILGDQKGTQLFPGDRLSIREVVQEVSDRRFDHLHDSQVRRAYLRITRCTGEVIDLDRPLTFWGVNRIREGATREAFDHVVGRICELAGKDDLEPARVGSGNPWSWPLEEQAFAFAYQARSAYEALLPLLPEDGTEDCRPHRAHLRVVINNAALAGFLLAKAEVRQAEKAAAGIWNNLKQAQEARLRTDLIDAATQVWAEHPTWTKNRVAEAVRGSAKLRGVITTIERVVPRTSPSHPDHPEHWKRKRPKAK